MDRELHIARPTFLLNEQKCRANIQVMADKAKREQVFFRPHFKTHQSLEVGRWFKECGVTAITVSSVDMAAYFSREWNDITIAFPLNLREMGSINELASGIHLNVLIDSFTSAEFLSQHASSPIGCFLEIDTGYHRTGIDPANRDETDRILSCLDTSPNLHFMGFLTHDGQTYTAGNPNIIRQMLVHSKKIMNEVKSRYINRYPDLLVSVGDTPACSIADNFDGVDEIRPGNFVFYDLMQQASGACEIEKIAVCMACPVVSVYPEREELVIYGGAVHFSKEYLSVDDSSMVFGQVVEASANGGWGKVIKGMQLLKLSQEHGTVSFPKKMQHAYKVGDLIHILPVHSCLTANLQKTYTLLNGSELTTLNSSKF